MALIEDIAERLSKRAIELVLHSEDEKLEKRISDEIGVSSPTLQEAFNTAMRIRKAEQRATVLMDTYERGEALPAARISSNPQDDGGH